MWGALLESQTYGTHVLDLAQALLRGSPVIVLHARLGLDWS